MTKTKEQTADDHNRGITKEVTNMTKTKEQTAAEAIKIMEKALGEHPYHKSTPFYRACQLGIEALKRINSARGQRTWCSIIPLPGEKEAYKKATQEARKHEQDDKS